MCHMNVQNDSQRTVLFMSSYVSHSWQWRSVLEKIGSVLCPSLRLGGTLTRSYLVLNGCQQHQPRHASRCKTKDVFCSPDVNACERLNMSQMSWMWTCLLPDLMKRLRSLWRRVRTAFRWIQMCCMAWQSDRQTEGIVSLFINTHPFIERNRTGGLMHPFQWCNGKILPEIL